MILPHFLDWNVTSIGGNARSRRAGTFVEEKWDASLGTFFVKLLPGIGMNSRKKYELSRLGPRGPAGWDGMNSRKKYEPDLRNSRDPRNPFPRAWEPDFPRILILVIQCL